MNTVSGIYLFEEITITEAHTPITSGLRMLRQGDHKFEVAGLQMHSRKSRGRRRRRGRKGHPSS